MLALAQVTKFMQLAAINYERELASEPPHLIPLNRLFLVAMLTCAAALCVYYADKLPPNTPCVARLLRRARPLRGHSPAIVEMLRSAPAKNELVREQGIGDGEESRLGGEERVGLAGERCESAQY